jgi:peptidoglycan-associated lipoprotein
MKKSFAIIAAVALLSACSGGVKEDSGAPVEDRKPGALAPQPVTPPPQVTQAKPTVKPIDSGTTSGNPLRDPGNILSKRSIYFDYDSSSVKEEFKPLISAHAKYLTDNRGRKIVIQGNTDERGSREYNLALGQRQEDDDAAWRDR